MLSEEIKFYIPMHITVLCTPHVGFEFVVNHPPDRAWPADRTLALFVNYRAHLSKSTRELGSSINFTCNVIANEVAFGLEHV